MGNLQQAKEYYERALDITLKKFGPEHAAVARTYNTLGGVHREMGNLHQAKKYYERALDIRLRRLGSEDIDVKRTYKMLDAVQNALEEQ